MSGLLVPMAVDAVVVRPGDPDEAWAQTAYLPPTLPARVPGAARQPRVRRAVFPPPFAVRSAPRKAGVHLHWALPDALTRLDADTGTLPALPCRWLVVRLGYADDGAGGLTTRTSAWLLPNLDDPASTWVRDGHLRDFPAGLAAPAATIRGQGTAQTFPGWAFYSDNVAGKLALHDPLDDPADAGLRGPLRYVVVGWYTHPQHDPLAPQDGRTVWEVLDELGWATSRRSPLSPPDRTVVHGAAVGIAWPTGTPPPAVPPEVDLRPSVAVVSAALADTLTAATTALAFPDATGAAEAVAEAVVAGQLDELDRPDGLARLDGTRHQLRFAAASSGQGERDVIFQAQEPGGPQLVGPGDPAGAGRGPQRRRRAARRIVRHPAAGVR